MANRFKISDPDIQLFFKQTIHEMNKAAKKHPYWPESPVERAAIVAEEAGEVIREANHIREGIGNTDALYMELIHTAGVCFRMLHIMQNNEPCGEVMDEDNFKSNVLFRGRLGNAK